MTIEFKSEETPPGVPTSTTPESSPIPENVTALPRNIGFDPAVLPSTSAGKGLASNENIESITDNSAISGVLNFPPSAPPIEDIESPKQKFNESETLSENIGLTEFEKKEINETMDDMRFPSFNSETKSENPESFINEKKEYFQIFNSTLDRLRATEYDFINEENDRIMDLRNNKKTQGYLEEEKRPIVEDNTTSFSCLLKLAVVRFVIELVCFYSLTFLPSVFEKVSIGLLFTCTVGLFVSVLTCLKSCQENSDSIQILEIFSILWSQMYLLFTTLVWLISTSSVTVAVVSGYLAATLYAYPGLRRCCFKKDIFEDYENECNRRELNDKSTSGRIYTKIVKYNVGNGHSTIEMDNN